MDGSLRSRARTAAILIALAQPIACTRSHTEPVKHFPLHGQILSVNQAKQELNIKHGDIPGFMPGMQMIYPVASAKLMEGRAPGELVDAVLEVQNSQGRLVEII